VFELKKRLNKREAGRRVIVVGAGPEAATTRLPDLPGYGRGFAIMVGVAALEKADSYVIGTCSPRYPHTEPRSDPFGKHAIGVDNGQVPAL
jgi:electron transfer flavoprotein alpha/beta subunit